MGYNDNIVFAIRIIFLYGELKNKFVYHKYTLLCGTLLNVFTAIIPDRKFIVKFENVLNMEIPHLPNKTCESIEKHLNSIRNGLAHKEQINFFPNVNDGKIESVEIKGKKYTIEDLEKILDFLQKAIQEYDNALYEYEKQNFTNLVQSNANNVT